MPEGVLNRGAAAVNLDTALRRLPLGGGPPPSLPRGLKSLRRGRLWSPMIRACGVKVPALSATKGDVLLRIRWDVLFLVK